MNWIVNAGTLAGSISAVLALIGLIIWKPLKSLRARETKEREEAKQFRKTMLDKLDAISDDIADLQYERLSQAHDFYMSQGWCPSSKKNQLCHMHQSYAAKGRNHLSKHYEEEILELPDKPTNGGKQND